MSRIPANAKKVFSGVIFDVYQWEQEMFDGSFATFERLKRPDTVVVVPVTKDGQILITRQEQPGKPPFIGLAGGRVDPGELPLSAAHRELLEETGYKTNQSLELWSEVQPVGKIDWTVYTYVARGCERVADLHLDAGEKITVEAVSFDEFVKFALEPDFYEKEVTDELLRATLKPNGREAIKRFLLEGEPL